MADRTLPVMLPPEFAAMVERSRVVGGFLLH